MRRVVTSAGLEPGLRQSSHSLGCSAEIDGLLCVEPELRRGSEGRTELEGHFGSHRRPRVDDSVDHLEVAAACHRRLQPPREASPTHCQVDPRPCRSPRATCAAPTANAIPQRGPASACTARHPWVSIVPDATRSFRPALGSARSARGPRSPSPRRRWWAPPAPPVIDTPTHLADKIRQSKGALEGRLGLEDLVPEVFGRVGARIGSSVRPRSRSLCRRRNDQARGALIAEARLGRALSSAGAADARERGRAVVAEPRGDRVLVAAL